MATSDAKPAFAYASARADDDIIASTDKFVPWWSISKTVLAAAVLRLADLGRLELDDHFRQQPFTIKQLLQHTAGVRTYGGEAYQKAVARSEPAWTVERLLDRVGVGTLAFEPGSGWSYSNVGYLFVRQLIEQALDTDLATALQELVFGPMEMTATRLARTPADLACTLWGNDSGYDPNWVYHGLLTGVPADAVMFLRGLRSTSFLSEGAQAAMQSVHPVGGALPGRPWTKTGYGLGLMIGDMAGVGRVYGHSGVGPDSVSALYHFQQLDPPVTVATFAQADDESTVENEAVRLARR